MERLDMSANRKHFFISFLILVLLIITMSCYSLDQAYENWRPREATKADQNSTSQVVSSPQPDPPQEAESDQPSAQNLTQQPPQLPSPQPDPEADPEPELSELEKCVANKDVVLVNEEVVVGQVNDEATGKLKSLSCTYITNMVSEASQPVVLLYQWNKYDGKIDRSVFHWQFTSSIQPGGEKEFLQDLDVVDFYPSNASLYDRLVSYVAIYDTPECQKYFNSMEIMRQTRSVFFECDRYIPKE